MTQRSKFRTPSGSLTSLSKILLATAAAFSAQAVSPPFTDFFTRSTPALLRRPTENCYRLLSSGFLHGSVSHILMNTYSLTQIGPEVESCFNPRRFTALYLSSIIGGNIISHNAALRRFPGTAPFGLGASGGVFGLLGGYYVFLRLNRSYFSSPGVDKGLESLTRTAAINAVGGIMVKGIDNYAHLGGAVTGAAYAYFWGPRLRRDGVGRLLDVPRFDELRGKFRNGWGCKGGEGTLKIKRGPRLPSYIG